VGQQAHTCACLGSLLRASFRSRACCLCLACFLSLFSC
jgi:hypothetical protein